MAAIRESKLLLAGTRVNNSNRRARKAVAAVQHLEMCSNPRCTLTLGLYVSHHRSPTSRLPTRRRYHGKSARCQQMHRTRLAQVQPWRTTRAVASSLEVFTMLKRAKKALTLSSSTRCSCGISSGTGTCHLLFADLRRMRTRKQMQRRTSAAVHVARLTRKSFWLISRLWR